MSALDEFGPFRLDPELPLLFCNGRKVTLQPQSVEVLRVLLSARDKWHSKESIFKAAWEEDVYVTDGALAQHIYTIKQALNDASDGYGECIQAQRKIGYRFSDEALQKLLQNAASIAGGQMGPTLSDRGVVGQFQHANAPARALSKDELLTIEEAEAIAGRSLYRYEGGHVSAIQLYGSAGQLLDPDDITTEYDHTAYVVPPELQAEGDERIRMLEEQARQKNRDFFDGPCARLLRFSAPAHEFGAQTSRRTLHLVLGRIGWYDFERTNGILRKQLAEGKGIQYERWVGLSAIVNEFTVDQSQLSNIVGNAITIITQDGYVGYQQRGPRPSVGPTKLTSAVAENIHRLFDQTKPGNLSQLLHPFLPGMKLKDGPKDATCPPLDGALHPSVSVRRGIEEETSWRMTEFIPPEGIKLTGLCFSLDALQPDLLWMVFVRCTAKEFTEEVEKYRGEGWQEGEIKFVPADFLHDGTQELLARPNWIAAGKASLVRALQVVERLKKANVSVAQIFDPGIE